MGSRGGFLQRSSDSGPGGTTGFTLIASAFQPNFDALNVDVAIGGGASADLASIPIVLAAPHIIQAWSSSAVQSTAGTTGFVFLEIDGVSVASGALNNALASFYHPSVNFQTTLAAGAHSIKLRMTCSGGALFCRPLAVPTGEFANLTVDILNI